MLHPTGGAALHAIPERPLIVVIDDDEPVRDSLRAVLEVRQFRVADFASGRAFLASHDDIPRAACLIVATQVADIAGIDLVRTLRLRRDFVPVILTTGQRSPGLETNSASLGAIALLDKPISPIVLLHAIQRALSAA